MTFKKIRKHTKDTVNQFIKERGILLPNGQVKLTESIYVFKKVYHNDKKSVHSLGSGLNRIQCIANLVIPAGAIVNLARNDSLKMRASQAYCYNIVSRYGSVEYNSASSIHDSSFKYHSGKALGLSLKDAKSLVEDHESVCLVKNGEAWPSSHTVQSKKLQTILGKCKVQPDTFSKSTDECAAGVHFFITSSKAILY